ncbi:Alpha/Beta hydrolase protein [Xylariomycetidae sp. FL2044]|nr:Alpha/Beta hydrolase protein [Xylariomycetidae sp. FL2044]
MAPYGLLQYLRLKIIVTLLRLWLRFTSKNAIARDRALVPWDVTRKRVKIPSRDLGRRILADLYYPCLPTEKTLPVLIKCHGIGFIFHLLGTDALFCARVARDAGVIVVDADYHKGPEHVFPAALHDAEDVLRWIAAQDHRFDLKNDYVALSGFSDGGTVPSATTTALRKTLTLLLKIRRTVPPCTRSSTWPRPRVQNDTASHQVTPGVESLAKRMQTEVPGKLVYHMVEGVPHAFDKGAEEGTMEWQRREELYAMVAAADIECSVEDVDCHDEKRMLR